MATKMATWSTKTRTQRPRTVRRHMAVMRPPRGRRRRKEGERGATGAGTRGRTIARWRHSTPHVLRHESPRTHIHLGRKQECDQRAHGCLRNRVEGAVGRAALLVKAREYPCLPRLCTSSPLRPPRPPLVGDVRRLFIRLPDDTPEAMTQSPANDDARMVGLGGVERSGVSDGIG